MTTSAGAAPRLTALAAIDELQQLRDLYARDWPAHCVGYYCLDNFVRWLEREPLNRNLQILTLDDGAWRLDGLCLIVDRYQLFVNSLNGAAEDSGSNRRLSLALGLLDWSRGYKVSSFLDRHRPAVLDVVQAKRLQLEYDSLTVMYYMPSDEARSLLIDCPPGYCVRPMEAVDARVVDALWPNRHQGSLFLIERLIAWNANMGVYVESSNELVAWCLRLQGGFLGALQVNDSHKRLGLGSLVARATSRRIAEMGHDVIALVNKNNVPSRRMFDKLGFRVTDTCHWLRTYPTDENFVWPDGE